jgi:arginase
MSHTTNGKSLRVVFPQWQACGVDYAAEFTGDLQRESVRHGYEVGPTILNAIFPGEADETVVVPVVGYDTGVDRGIESRSAVLENLRAATARIAEQDPDRITTFGGDCSVAVPSVAHLAAKYDDDLAIIWLDSHPDCSTPGGNYQGYHDMALAHLTGHGDEEFLKELPQTISPERVLLAGTHSWNDDEYENVQEWGIKLLSPDELRSSLEAVVEWLKATGCSKFVLHVDFDSIDSAEYHLGMGAESGGLTKNQVQAIISAVSTQQDIELVGFNLAEFIPRQVLAIQEVIKDVPLL